VNFIHPWFKTTRTAWPAWPSSDVLYINCTQNQFCSKQHSTHVQCTTEKFKSDDEVQISAEDKDIDAEVDIFLNEKICKMFCSVTCSEGWY